MFRRNPLVSYRVRYTYFHAEVLPRIWGLGRWFGVVEERFSATSPVRSAYPQGVRRIRKAAKPPTAAQSLRTTRA